MQFIVEPSTVRDTKITVPGDKSISHRALMLGGIAEGRTEISGFLAGDDCLATLAAMASLGVPIQRTDATHVRIEGVGLNGLQTPPGALDLGNSGTAMRLMAGILSGQSFASELTGDASLTVRPMQRIIAPLNAMGATIESDDGRPPLRISGRFPLSAIDYELPVASAQVKSAVLLAGLYADGTTSITEPAITRDHTERMLATMGAKICKTANRISIERSPKLNACQIEVPADLSSAAFVILAALLAKAADVLIVGVGVNPTRTGVIDILQSMGGTISLENPRMFGEEPVADIRVRSSTLHGGSVDPRLVSLAIDEFPVLFIAASQARGQTVFSGIGELRVKESDRIAVMTEGLRALGVDVVETKDGAVVHYGRLRGGNVDSHGDHRIAMSFVVAAATAESVVTVRDVAAVNTSFPEFRETMTSLGVAITTAESSV